MRCPGSIAAEEGLPDVPSKPAAEGTFGHEVLLELCLPFGIEPHYYIGRKRTVDGFEFELTEDMADALLVVYDEVIDLPGTHFYEKTLSLEKWLEGDFGTTDCGIIDDEYVTIRDLKFGEGIPVSPVRNEQLMAYGLSFCAWLNEQGYKLRGRKIRFVIDQPRCPGGGGTWECTLDELIEFGHELRAAGKRAMKPDVPRVPGPKQCMWCKAANTCAPLAEYNLALAQQDFEDLEADELEFPDPNKLSVMERGLILKHESSIKLWLKKLAFAALQDAVADRPAGGFKAVLGRSPARTWVDEEKIVEVLTEEEIDPYSEPKVLSPAQAEEKLKKKYPARTKEQKAIRAERMAALKEEIVEGIPKPILVPETDSRPKFVSAEALFDDLSEEDE